MMIQVQVDKNELDGIIRFQKFKVARKWLFPAKDAEEFLGTCLKKQGGAS